MNACFTKNGSYISCTFDNFEDSRIFNRRNAMFGKARKVSICRVVALFGAIQKAKHGEKELLLSQALSISLQKIRKYLMSDR